MIIHIFSKLPPPLTGQTLGTKIVYDFLNSKNFNLNLYNISISKKLKKEQFNLIYSFKLILKFLTQLYSLKRKIKFGDVVYFIPASSFFGILKDVVFCFFLKNNVRIVGHVRSGNLPIIYNSYRLKLLTNYIINKVTLYIFLSKNLSTAAGSIPSHKKTFVKNPIDSEIVGSVDEINKRLNKIKNRNTNNLKIIFISNMIKSKGYFDLLESVEYLKSCFNFNFSITFIGKWRNNKDKIEFFNQLSKVNLIENIDCKYVGYLDNRKEIKKYLLDSDLFCLPTYYPVEAQPRSIIEAMSNGLPIISTNHASIPEVVQDKKNGFLINPKDPLKIAESIINYTNKETLIKHSKTSYEIYNKDFAETQLLNLLTKKIINE